MPSYSFLSVLKRTAEKFLPLCLPLCWRTYGCKWRQTRNGLRVFLWSSWTHPWRCFNQKIFLWPLRILGADSFLFEQFKEIRPRFASTRQASHIWHLTTWLLLILKSSFPPWSETSKIQNQQVLSPKKLHHIILTSENLLLHPFLHRSNLFLSLKKILEFDTIKEIEVLLNPLESVSDGLLKALLALYGFFLEFGYVFKKFLFHGFSQSIVLG